MKNVYELYLSLNNKKTGIYLTNSRPIIYYSFSYTHYKIYPPPAS